MTPTYQVPPNVDTLTRQALIAEARKRFGASVATWAIHATKEALLAAVKTGEIDDKSAQSGAGADLAALIAAAVSPLVNASLDETRAREIAEEVVTAALASRPTREITIVRADGTRVPVGRQHRTFALLLSVIATRTPVMLVGPAGGGKTFAGEVVAQALGLDFYPYSVGPDTRAAHMLGYMHAGGEFVPGPLYVPFKDGGVFLIDEADTAHPAVMTTLNAALANGYMMFPNGELVRRHADCVIIAGANTYGRGADAEYVGRSPIDAATRNRFAYITWDYDEELEREIALAQNPNAGEWITHVQRLRAAKERARVRHVISPRASIYGARALASGIDRDACEEMFVWQGLGRDDRAKILANVTRS